MDIGQGILLGFSVAITPTNLFFCLVGVVLGTVVGILPGLGTTATIALLMPVTYGMNPTTMIIMMAGIYSGSKYGGAVTSILMNLPGEASSVVTCLDGYQLALQGRAGPALGMAALSSFFGGTVGIIGMTLLGPFLAAVAIGFGPPEYFAMCFMGLALVTSLTGSSISKGTLATLLGLILAMVGSDKFVGTSRLIFGRLELLDGVDFVIVMVGLFALGEVFLNVERQVKVSLMEVPRKLSQLLPSLAEVRQCTGTWIRSTTLGFVVGALPATGASMCAMLSYGLARNFSKTPERFGKGALEGVAASESADNAAVGANIAPTLTLGIPGSGSTAMMMGALIVAGVRPGPLLLTEHPEVFWGVTASCYIGNVMLLIINLPMIPLLVNILRIPYYILYIIIIAVASIGVYSIDGNFFDLWVMGVFGVLGYIFKKLDYPLAPVALALILGPLVEKSFRQTLIMSGGGFGIYIDRPLAGIMVAIGILGFLFPLIQSAWLRKSREAGSLSLRES